MKISKSNKGDCTTGSGLIYSISRTKIQSMFNQSTHIIKQYLSPIASSTLRYGKKMLLSNKNVYRFYLKKNLPSTISFFTFRDFHRSECCSKEVRWPNKYKFLLWVSSIHTPFNKNPAVFLYIRNRFQDQRLKKNLN